MTYNFAQNNTKDQTNDVYYKKNPIKVLPENMSQK